MSLPLAFRSVCPLDCPDTCALQISIQDGRMVKLSGATDHPITRGFACVKMARYPERQEHPDRLLVPQKRVGLKGEGRFVAVSWEEALDEIAARMKANIAEFGEQTVLPFSYAGTMGLIERDFPLAFFRGIGASELVWSICAATGGAAWEANYGPNKMSTAPEDVAFAPLIVLWGINVSRSNSHLVPFLKEARKRGAQIIHIDPYHNETSRFADTHLQIRVGTDAALALALGGEILSQGAEDASYLQQYANDLSDYRAACAEWTLPRAAEFCGLELQDVEQLARCLVQHPGFFVKLGYGMTRNEGGGNAARAITLLPALTGAWQHRGGGGALSTSGAFPLNESRYSGKHLLKANRRHINQVGFGDALNERGALSTLFIFNSNPAAVAPDSGAVLRGLRREDLFTVVIDHFQTDSADYADYLLPATTFIEHPDMYAAYGHYCLQWAEPIVQPRGQARPNSWIFKELAARMGLRDRVFRMSTEELAADLLDSDDPFLRGITVERLKRERSIQLNLPEKFRPYAKGSNHADRKIRFSPAPSQLEFKVQPTASYPLRLISPPGPYILNTSMGNLESIRRAAGGEPHVIIHPADAAAVNLTDSQAVRLVSPNGSIVRKAMISTDARQGVVVAVGQWWPKLAPDKKGLNELTSQRTTDLGEGSTFGNQTVRIEKVD